MQIILFSLMLTKSSLLPEVIHYNAIALELVLPVLNEQLRVLHAEIIALVGKRYFPNMALCHDWG